MINFLKELIIKQKQGTSAGIYSVCSAHPWVLRAAFARALKDNTPVLIEATSNQVNQDGGYTGMTPKDFTKYIISLAKETGFPQSRIILGGDHLGPNVWQNLNADVAMRKSEILVADCVKAGFRKIHLDASMTCADDLAKYGHILPDEIVAVRAASLCRAAENAYNENPTEGKPLYVIGTEVPVPGGAQDENEKVKVSSNSDVRRTIETAKNEFYKLGLQEAWERVIAVVVQPGVEFNNSEITEYNREKASSLSDFIKQDSSRVFEAHSTDYQTFRALKELVDDQFSILKVGPWLTFAFREAVYALSMIEKEMYSGMSDINLASVPGTIDRVMMENPVYWDKYYKGTDPEKEFARKYSLSDRLRYYWVNPTVNEALSKLLVRLNEQTIPFSLLSQFMPGQYEQVREGRMRNKAYDLIISKIDEVLRLYSRACGNSENNMINLNGRAV